MRQKKLLLSAGVMGASMLASLMVVEANRLVAAALFCYGRPYYWGAKGPWKLDCSGLIQYAHGLIGIEIAPAITEQAQNAPYRVVLDGDGAYGKTILRTGDCIGFGWQENGRYIHGGIAISPGFVIHASGGEACPNHPTSRCRVVVDSVDHWNESYWRSIYRYVS